LTKTSSGLKEQKEYYEPQKLANKRGKFEISFLRVSRIILLALKFESKEASQTLHRKFSTTKKIKGGSTSATKPGKLLMKRKDVLNQIPNEFVSWIKPTTSSTEKIKRSERRDWRKTGVQKTNDFKNCTR
jgi:hypothetical protein